MVRSQRLLHLLLVPPINVQSDPIARSSGLVINTMGWIDGGGYDLILETIKSLQADVIVVMGHDRLFAQLSEDVKTIKYHSPSSAAAGSADAGASSAAGGAQPTKHIEVIKLNRPGGVVERSRETRRDARKSRIKEYFYGPDRVSGCIIHLAVALRSRAGTVELQSASQDRSCTPSE